MFHHDWPNHTKPQDAVKEIQDPKHVKSHKRLNVTFSNADSHPDAMMIIPSDAYITVGAMSSIWWLEHIAKVTPPVFG
jgi:hypothetical protein